MDPQVSWTHLIKRYIKETTNTLYNYNYNNPILPVPLCCSDASKGLGEIYPAGKWKQT